MPGCPPSSPGETCGRAGVERAPAPLADGPAPAPPPTPPAAITLTRADGRTTIELEEPLEELLAVPGGVVWTQSGEVWAAFDAAGDPTRLAALTDPHGLATDGHAVFWVGDRDNGRWDLAKGELSSWPVFAGPGEQAALAFGDVLYGRDSHGLWRLDGTSARRLPFRFEPRWRVLPGLGAGKDRVVVPVLAAGPDGARMQYVRVRGSGKHTIIATKRRPARGGWAVNGAGDLAFVHDGAGGVAVVEAGRDTARVVLAAPGVALLCWCGRDLCTVANGQLRRHEGSTIEPIADPGEVAQLSCTAERAAWSSTIDGRPRIGVQILSRD